MKSIDELQGGAISLMKQTMPLTPVQLKYPFPVRPGRMLFEMEGVTLEEAKLALRVASFKLPIRTAFVQREHL